MTASFTGQPATDKTAYAVGDTIHVSQGTVKASVLNDVAGALVITETADDGTTNVYNATVTVHRPKAVGTRITAVTLDGVPGTISADGQSATFTVS